jgi:hypothetical protein
MPVMRGTSSGLRQRRSVRIAPVATLFAGLLALSGSSCGSTTTPDGEVLRAISIRPATMTLRVGEEAQLAASKLNVSERAPIRWRSREPGIASVDSSGVVRGVQPGIATIYAEADGVAGAATIKVVEP